MRQDSSLPFLLRKITLDVALLHSWQSSFRGPFLITICYNLIGYDIDRRAKQRMLRSHVDYIVVLTVSAFSPSRRFDETHQWRPWGVWLWFYFFQASPTRTKKMLMVNAVLLLVSPLWTVCSRPSPTYLVFRNLVRTASKSFVSKKQHGWPFP